MFLGPIYDSLLRTVIWVVTQRFSPTSFSTHLVGEKRCVTTQITAAEETKFTVVSKRLKRLLIVRKKVEFLQSFFRAKAMAQIVFKIAVNVTPLMLAYV